MVGRLEAGGRIAAAALLALGSLAPVGGPLLVATPVPTADESAGCPVTVGTATTDPALAADAARAIAVGYATTDCLPDAQLLAAAEARAAMAMGNTTPTPATTAMTGTLSGVLAGSRSSGSGVVAAPGTTTTTAPTPASAAADPATVAPTETTTTSATDTSAAGTDAGEDSLSGSDGGTSSDSNDGTSSGSDGEEDPATDTPTSELPGNNAGCVESGSVAATNATTTSGTTTSGTTTDGATTTAACKLSWGAATEVEEFDDASLANWSRYDGPGHADNGVRSPSAMSVNDGILTITGDSNGTTGGMAWKLGRSSDGRPQYGRWEARVRAPRADPSYNAVMLLWPDAENWPEGGEVDFMEIGDETRRQVDFFLHYGAENHQLHGSTQIDATQWHNWAVEWSPTKITGYVDGTEWFSTTQADALPPGAMHLTLQLDWFPTGGSVQQSTMDVDWVRYYPIDGSGNPGTIVNSLGATSATGSALSGTTAGTATGEAGDPVSGSGGGAADVTTEIVESNTPTPTSPAGAPTTPTSAITGVSPSVGAGTASTDPGGSSAPG